MIKVFGAKEHNLKNVDIQIPKNSFVVITGLSGSGKTSLAIDTIYTEGQRRYLESISPYVRQFIGKLKKPNVKKIEGLAPSICIEQRKLSHNPRSTVGTLTEIYDYLRLLFSKAGVPHCPNCGREVVKQSIDTMVENIMSEAFNKNILILSPIIKNKKGEFRKLLLNLKKEGFIRIRIDDYIYRLDEEIELDRKKYHNIDIVVDRVLVNKDNYVRIEESMEIALNKSDGFANIIVLDKNRNEIKNILFSSKLVCPVCNISLPEIEPALFSFNSPKGACPACGGLGFSYNISEDLLIDYDLSLNAGAILPWRNTSYENKYINFITRYFDIDPSKKYKDLPKNVKEFILNGKYIDDNIYYYGIKKWIEKRYRETASEDIKESIREKYMRYEKCKVCNGSRLKKEALSVTINGKNIDEINKMSIYELNDFISSITLTKNQNIILKDVILELKRRTKLLVEVGVGYLTFDRMAHTLSGGESQRIRLATQIGAGLTGVIYVLDEPTIGLHERDTEKLIKTLKNLRDIQNTIIVVEHDEEVIKSADYIIEIGPKSGDEGGEITFQGKIKELYSSNTLTGKYLSKRLKINIPKTRRSGNGKFLVIHGARQNNLKNLTVKFPLGKFIAITGVSGSGKSSLIMDTLYPALANVLKKSRYKDGIYDSINGIENIDNVLEIDQSPIGRSPKSTPATYTKVFDEIRKFYAKLPEARIRGYAPARFSYNVPSKNFGGRCETCQGYGMIKVEMQFLPDAYIVCEDCKGKRYNRETLEVKYKGKNISDILNMSVTDARKLFENIPSILKILRVLEEVGLGYIKLGQPAPTLSGGEAQRIKLSSELRKRFSGHTFYILDEPTTGLHVDDVKRLIKVLNNLVDKNNTVVIIEHNMEIIKSADWIIDLGPEGGEKGGYIVFEGTPEEIIKSQKSYTGRYLRKYIV